MCPQFVFGALREGVDLTYFSHWAVIFRTLGLSHEDKFGKNNDNTWYGERDKQMKESGVFVQFGNVYQGNFDMIIWMHMTCGDSGQNMENVKCSEISN